MKYTVKFSGAEEIVATFDSDTNAVTSPDGRTGSYQRDGVKLTISGDQNVVITFASEPALEVGASAAYTTSDGRSGTATIMSVG